jgi:hypothetical protein
MRVTRKPTSHLRLPGLASVAALGALRTILVATAVLPAGRTTLNYGPLGLLRRETEFPFHHLLAFHGLNRFTNLAPSIQCKEPARDQNS